MIDKVAICPSATDHKSVPPRGAEPQALPEHLARIAGSPWALCRWVGLQSTGFPAAQALTLANPQCAAGADRLIEAQDVARQARSQAIDIIESAMGRADTNGRASLER